MPGYYEYLLSSLPMLSFGGKPPFTFERLVSACRDLISDGDIEALKAAALPGAVRCGETGNKTLVKWRSFDTMLRNELVQIRAVRRKDDASKYLRQDGCPESAYAAHIAINAYRKPSLLEAERTLDLERWRALDDFSTGHYFDLDALIVYGAKLLIMEKWDKIQAADRKGLLEAALAPAPVGEL